MTDGVSDPLFSSESKILGERGWDDFYKAIAPVLRDSGNKAEDQLVEWLNFYAPSHNDDRTIAMIFPGSDRSEILAYGEGLPDV
jgi:peptide methionine sulfoxide reductase MsrB